MLSWVGNWMLSYSATPEKLAQRALNNMRLELFKSEQMVLDAHQRAEYFRQRIEFLELVVAQGIERTTDLRAAPSPIRRGPTRVMAERASAAAAP